MGRRGFTLLEVLVATTLMAIAVVGLLANLRTSLSNAARLTDYDRATQLARHQMDELLASKHLPKGVPFEGTFSPQVTGGVAAGWRARVLPFESVAAPGMPPPMGTRFLERLQLEVWWMRGPQRRTFALESYRSAEIAPADVEAIQAFAAEMAR